MDAGGMGSARRNKPLLDIEDVRAFIRSKFGEPKNGSSHGGHVGSSLSSGVFGIGTMGTSSAEGGYVPLSSHTHHEHHHHGHGHGQQHNGDQTMMIPPSHHAGEEKERHHHHHHQQQQQQDVSGDGYAPVSAPILDIDEVRDLVNGFLHHTHIRRRPSTSWRNKMPWHVPPPPFLAKGLQWPPETFDSEEHRREFYRNARKRKPFLMGSPPLWTVTAFNLLFFQILMFNPGKKFFDFLRKLP